MDGSYFVERQITSRPSNERLVDATEPLWEETARALAPNLWAKLAAVEFTQSTHFDALSDLDDLELHRELDELCNIRADPVDLLEFKALVLRSASFACIKRRRIIAACSNPGFRQVATKLIPVFTERETLLMSRCTLDQNGIKQPVASGRQRESKENLRKRLVIVIGQILEECAMPIISLMLSSAAPERLLEKLGGGRRLSTLRQRVREFKHLRAYMMTAHLKPFPDKAVELLDYIMERGNEPCSPSTPNSILTMIAFFEDLGGRPKEHQLSNLSVVRRLVDDLKLSLVSRVGTVKKKAHELFVVFLASWEVMIGDTSYTEVFRIIVWGRLIKVWASLRTADNSGIDPNSLRNVGGDLHGIIGTSKTTGTGKRIAQMEFVISSHSWLVDKGWLMNGFELFRQHLTGRAFFLPLPLPSMGGFSDSEPSFSEENNAHRKLLSDTPGITYSDHNDDGFVHWKLDAKPLLLDRKSVCRERVFDDV
jgi:hypothetical protein